jgi:hypothetical protein
VGAVVDDVDDVVVVVVVVDVGGGASEAGCMTNPQPCDGSLRESGTETGVSAGEDVVVVEGVVVVVVGPVVETDDVVVDVVGDETVVDVVR